eukprot:scaffold88036_cov61-Phaeocystis_antarctica.AAC.5
MEADAAGRSQAGDGEDLGDRLGRAVIGHARPLRGLVRVVAGRGDQRALAHGDELGEGRDGRSHRRHCCGADAIQRAEGGQPLEQMGALELGDRSLGRALAAVLGGVHLVLVLQAPKVSAIGKSSAGAGLLRQWVAVGLHLVPRTGVGDAAVPVGRHLVIVHGGTVLGVAALGSGAGLGVAALGSGAGLGVAALGGGARLEVAALVGL